MKSINVIQDILLTRLLKYRIASTFSPIRFRGGKFINLLVKYIFDKI